MHKQFKKFGFFAPVHNDTTTILKNDEKTKDQLQYLLNSKDVSTLSRKEKHALKKYCQDSGASAIKPKINDENQKKRKTHHHHHRKNGARTDNDGQLFFLSPQDIKKHKERKSSSDKITKNKEKHHHRHHHHHRTHRIKSNPSKLVKIDNYESGSLIRKHSKLGNGDQKLKKERKKSGSRERSNSTTLNPKEIVQFMAKSQDVASASNNSNSLNDYFIFEPTTGKKGITKEHRHKHHHKTKKTKEDSREVGVVAKSSSIPKNYLSEIPQVFKEDAMDVLKLLGDGDLTNRENKVDIMFQRESLEVKSSGSQIMSKPHKKSRHKKKDKHRELEKNSSTQNSEEKHHEKMNDQNEGKKHKKKTDSSSLEKSSSNEPSPISEVPGSGSTTTSERKSRKTYQEKKKKSLIQKMNSIIEILPNPFNRTDEPIEMKKRSSLFRKYYAYDDKNPGFDKKVSTISAASDSHRLYQSISEHADLEAVKDEEVQKSHEDKIKLKIDKKKTSSKIPKLMRSSTNISKKSIKTRNSSVDRNCLRISRDKFSSELKTTKTQCKIFEDAKNLSAFDQNCKQSTTTTCQSIDNNDSFTTTGTDSVRVEFIEKKGIQEILNESPDHRVDSYEVEYHCKEKKPKKKVTQKIDLPAMNVRNDIKAQHSSKSETNLSEKSRDFKKKLKEKSPNKTTSNYTNSRSVSLDRLGDSPRNTTTLLLTKTFKDQDKMSRFQKSRLYSETIRKNLLKNQNVAGKIVPPHVLEVRFLTVSNDNNHLKGDLSHKHNYVMSPRPLAKKCKKKIPPLVSSSVPSTKPKTYCRKMARKAKVEDRTQPKNGELQTAETKKEPCLKLIPREQFEQLFEMPIDESLNAILDENSSFLKKDFSYTEPPCFESCDDFDSDENDLKSCREFDYQPTSSSNTNESWQNFVIDHPSNILHDNTSSTNRMMRNKGKYQKYPRPKDRKSQEKIAGSSSAPASEESGYSTVRSTCHSFFECKPIKALIFPNKTSPKISKILSNRRLLEKPSTSSTITSLDLSQDKIPEIIKFSDESDCGVSTQKHDRVPSKKSSIDTIIEAQENRDADSILNESIFSLSHREDLDKEELPPFTPSGNSESSHVHVVDDDGKTKQCKSKRKSRWGKIFNITFSCIKGQQNKDS